MRSVTPEDGTPRDEAVHTYIADMAMQLSLLAEQIGNEALSQDLNRAASTARDPYEKDQART
ncbi:MAG: hypothetical protein QM645_09815 [Asticcacaulis sp.]